MNIVTTGLPSEIKMEDFTIHQKGGFVVIVSNKNPTQTVGLNELTENEKKTLIQNMEDHVKRLEAKSKDTYIDNDPIPEELPKKKRSYCKICNNSGYDRQGKPCRRC